MIGSASSYCNVKGLFWIYVVNVATSDASVFDTRTYILGSVFDIIPTLSTKYKSGTTLTLSHTKLPALSTVANGLKSECTPV